jgi:hypothetical protein
MRRNDIESVILNINFKTILKEAVEIRSILGASVKTAKRKQRLS